MKEIFSAKVTAGSRTYFFDVKESAAGDRYMVISESRQQDGGFTHQRVMVFDEHMEKFSEAFDQALWTMARRESHAAPVHETPMTKHAYRVEELRNQYPKAYEKWTSAEDEHLKREHQAGASIAALAALLQRQPSAIQSRLRKLGLLSA